MNPSNWTPPLGYIEPANRTQSQADAHQTALGRMRAFTLAPVTLAPGQKVVLTDFLKDPDVVADMGGLFTGFHQLTGSCVGAATGNTTALLSAIQRKLADSPTKAFIPWWLFDYGRCRFNEGDRGQGEGAVSSVMGQTLQDDGTFGITEVPGLPAFDTSDGWALTKKIEMQWSDGAGPSSQYLALGRTHKFGTRGPVYDTPSIVTSVVNGCPVLNGCSFYVGNGKIVGSGDTAYVRGTYNGRGGHETQFMAAWNHPNDGLLFGYWNQWPTSTYPNDPAGLPRCAVWVPESEVAARLKPGGGIDRGEMFAATHLDYFPAQADKILSFLDMWGAP